MDKKDNARDMNEQKNPNKVQEPVQKEKDQQDPSQIHSNPSNINDPDISGSVC